MENKVKSSNKNGLTRRVCFDEEKNVCFYEDPIFSEALKMSRQSDFAQREADKARMERLIAPILTEHHRNQIRTRLKLYEHQNT